MEETRKLYYEDAYRREFSARVLSCEEENGAWRVILDQTAFYPEGGGQPCDLGTLGGVSVTDVRERDGAIEHTCSAPLAVGSEVVGAIDWERRFDHMQQHSGEHIVSGMLCARFDCDNVGFHMGADAVTIDYNAEISWEALAEIEREANRYLRENHAAEIALFEGAALAAIPYRSKKELAGAVRIVKFDGADCCACCGTHVSRSGEVGLVKFLSVQPFRGGARIELLCGGRAERYLAAVYDAAKRAGQRLSVKPELLDAAAERLLAERDALKADLAALETEVNTALADRFADCGDALLFRPAMKSDAVRRLADAVASRCGGLAAVFSGEGEVWQYALVRADGQDISALVKSLNAALRGRGGGRGGFAQGSVQCAQSEIEAFWNAR
ncbi:MAG: alanyl-tRNA editing protein [Oscillibacter sp.]|nr:alanyl-tRNA editing protein [Oscillibacter sp.]